MFVLIMIIHWFKKDIASMIKKKLTADSSVTTKVTFELKHLVFYTSRFHDENVYSTFER